MTMVRKGTEHWTPEERAEHEMAIAEAADLFGMKAAEDIAALFRFVGRDLVRRHVEAYSEPPDVEAAFWWTMEQIVALGRLPTEAPVPRLSRSPTPDA